MVSAREKLIIKNFASYTSTKDLIVNLKKNIIVNFFNFSFITGSYDRTCKVWDTGSGEELHTLDGHRNVVYAIGFNNPYGYKLKKEILFILIIGKLNQKNLLYF